MEFLHDSRLYAYHLEHDNDIFLNNTIIIECNFDRTYINTLYYIYNRLVENNRTDILTDLAIGSNDNEEVIMCLTAITDNRTDIIDLLVANNFNLNRQIVDPNYVNSKLLEEIDNYTRGSIVAYAQYRGSIDMYRHLINLGADPLLFDTDTVYYSYYSEYNYTNYLIELGIPPHRLQSYLGAYLSYFCDHSIKKHGSTNNFEDIQRLIDYGVKPDVYISKDIISVNNMLRAMTALPVDKFCYLCANGFYVAETNRPKFMYDVICAKNTDLLAYLMANGYDVGAKTLDRLLNQTCHSIDTLKILLTIEMDYSTLGVDVETEALLDMLDEKGLSRSMILTRILYK